MNMADVRFYHMERQTLEQVLPMLLGKALQGGHRIIVRVKEESQVEPLNGFLWSYDPNSFIPHGSAKDGCAEDQPIWITNKEENPNSADVLILCQGAESKNLESFSMVCEMLDGRNEDDVRAARVRWGVYKDSGDHDLTYWQQSPEGRWEEKSKV